MPRPRAASLLRASATDRESRRGTTTQSRVPSRPGRAIMAPPWACTGITTVCPATSQSFASSGSVAISTIGGPPSAPNRRHAFGPLTNTIRSSSRPPPAVPDVSPAAAMKSRASPTAGVSTTICPRPSSMRFCKSSAALWRPARATAESNSPPVLRWRLVHHLGPILNSSGCSPSRCATQNSAPGALRSHETMSSRPRARTSRQRRLTGRFAAHLSRSRQVRSDTAT